MHLTFVFTPLEQNCNNIDLQCTLSLENLPHLARYNFENRDTWTDWDNI